MGLCYSSNAQSREGHELHFSICSILDVDVIKQSLGGCGILGVGVWLSVTQGSFATLSTSLPSLSAANLLIAVGTIIMVIGCLGCVGAVKESRPLLLSVSTIFTMLWESALFLS
ncbi:tetraspanin-4a isoform X1 [Tachysurus ichikawai]